MHAKTLEVYHIEAKYKFMLIVYWDIWRMYCDKKECNLQKKQSSTWHIYLKTQRAHMGQSKCISIMKLLTN